MTAYGHLGHIHVNEQGSFGLIYTDSLEAVPIISENLAESIEQLVEENMRGRHAAGPTHEGIRGSAGPIRMQPLPDQLGTFLRAACGQGSVAVVNSANVHKFFPLATSDWSEKSPFPPLTAVVHRNVSSADAYGDMVVNGLSLEIAHSQLLAMGVDFIGGQHTNVAPTTPTFIAGLPWAWDQGSLSFGGVGVEELRSMTIQQTNNVEAIYTVANSKTPQRIKRNGYPEITATATICINAAVHSYIDSVFQSQAESQVLLNFNGVTSPGNLQIDIPQGRITAYAPQLGGPGTIEADITIMGKFDETSNYLVEYTLTNCRLSYP